MSCGAIYFLSPRRNDDALVESLCFVAYRCAFLVRGIITKHTLTWHTTVPCRPSIQVVVAVVKATHKVAFTLEVAIAISFVLETWRLKCTALWVRPHTIAAYKYKFSIVVKNSTGVMGYKKIELNFV